MKNTDGKVEKDKKKNEGYIKKVRIIQIKKEDNGKIEVVDIFDIRL